MKEALDQQNVISKGFNLLFQQQNNKEKKKRKTQKRE